MKIYKISQGINIGYDTYDSAIVYAEDEDEARKISPGYCNVLTKEQYDKEIASGNIYELSSWAYIEAINVEYLGEATDNIESGLILGSFNAG